MTARVVHCQREPFDTYVGRPSLFGNPFPARQTGSRQASIRAFAVYLAGSPELIARVRRELQGKALGCWCHPRACHGDVLAAVAEMNDAELSAWRRATLSPSPAVLAADEQGALFNDHPAE